MHLICISQVYRIQTLRPKEAMNTRFYQDCVESQVAAAKLLRHFSHVRLCATPQMAARQAPLSLGLNMFVQIHKNAFALERW